MKHLKTFEDTKKGKVWQINAKIPNLIVALKKIGMNNSEIKYWYNVFKKNNKNNNDFQIYINKTFDNNWHWGFYTGHYDPTIKFNSEFMGVVDVTEEEIAAYKYNI